MAIDKRLDPGRSDAGALAENRGQQRHRAAARTTAGRRAGVPLRKGHSREACPVTLRERRQAVHPGPRRVAPESWKRLIDVLDSRQAARDERLS